MSADPSTPRHAELVSAPIGPEARFAQNTLSGTAPLPQHTAVQVETWTLKQVQGDDKGYDRGRAHPRAFTGRHMAAIMIGFFAVVISVNVFMARQASATFGGVVVENSYVASQHFNRWLDEAASESALGWQADLTRRADGRVALTLTGPKDAPRQVTAVARHPLGHQRDQALRFVPDGAGRYLSTQVLPAGRWRLRLEVQAADKLWRSEGDIR